MRHVIQDTDVLLIYVILFVWLYFCQNFDDIHLFDIQERHQYGLYINILLIQRILIINTCAMHCIWIYDKQ